MPRPAAKESQRSRHVSKAVRGGLPSFYSLQKSLDPASRMEYTSQCVMVRSTAGLAGIMLLGSLFK